MAPAAPPAGRPTVVLFGDSLTQFSFSEGGWGAGMADAYQRRADVLNRGLSGYNTRCGGPGHTMVLPRAAAPARARAAQRKQVSGDTVAKCFKLIWAEHMTIHLKSVMIKSPSSTTRSSCLCAESSLAEESSNIHPARSPDWLSPPLSCCPEGAECPITGSLFT